MARGWSVTPPHILLHFAWIREMQRPQRHRSTAREALHRSRRSKPYLIRPNYTPVFGKSTLLISAPLRYHFYIFSENAVAVSRRASSSQPARALQAASPKLVQPVTIFPHTPPPFLATIIHTSSPGSSPAHSAFDFKYNTPSLTRISCTSPPAMRTPETSMLLAVIDKRCTERVLNMTASPTENWAIDRVLE